MTTADRDEMWGDVLGELVLMKCPCCGTDLDTHTLTEVLRCGQEALRSTGACRYCKAPLPPNQRGEPGRRKEFCSDGCRNAWWQKRPNRRLVQAGRERDVADADN